jgi:long-chain acyl-CoA synthetase
MELAGKPALYFGGETYTYADLDAAANHAASRLRTLGVGNGDAVAIVLPDAPGMVAYLVGILRIGAVVVPLNPLLTPRELLQLLQDSDAQALVTTVVLGLQIEQLRVESPWLPSAGNSERGTADHRAFVIFTSGTTGRAKGVVLSHLNVLANTAQVAERTALTAADRQHDRRPG